MKKIILPFLSCLICVSLKAQTAYDENTSITGLPTGIFYQPGPGANNTLHWQYPYGTKLTVNSDAFRNFELCISTRPLGQIEFRQWDANNNRWTPWRELVMNDTLGKLNNSFIQNQTSSYQNANFWINGYARVGGAEGVYKNYLKSVYYIGNAYSGLVLESNGSINYGITGSFSPGFSFRWMAHSNGEINYAGNTDLVMRLSSSGLLYVKDRILVGKTSQTNTSYKLDVNGNVRANKVVVNTTGADFVFDSTYQLLPLDSLENYFQSYHHLPGIQPAAEMRQQGVDVGENQNKLLQKVEELTRYVVDLNKQVQELKRTNQQLIQQNESLKIHRPYHKIKINQQQNTHLNDPQK